MRNVLFFLTIALIVSCRYVTIVYHTYPEKPESIMTWEDEYKPTPAFEWYCPIDRGLNPINNHELLITPNEALRLNTHTIEGISDTLKIDR